MVSKVVVEILGAAPKRLSPIRSQRQVLAQALRQIRVRREEAAEGHQIRITLFQNGFSTTAVEPTCGDYFSVIDPAQESRSDCGRVSSIVSTPFTRGSMMCR
jgi:hypothetical protein